MPAPFKMFWEFLGLLLKRYATLATGGAMMAAVWFAKDVAHWNVPNWINPFLATLFLLLAAFLTWRDERKAKEEALSRIQNTEDVRRIQDSLTALLNEGKSIRTHERGHIEQEAARKACIEWEAKVVDYVGRELSSFALTQFKRPLRDVKGRPTLQQVHVVKLEELTRIAEDVDAYIKPVLRCPDVAISEHSQIT